MATAIARSLRAFGAFVEKAGPYLLLELLLPGGTLFALLLYAYRRSSAADGGALHATLARRSASLLCRLIAARVPDIAPAWRGRHRERDGLEALAF